MTPAVIDPDQNLCILVAGADIGIAIAIYIAQSSRMVIRII